MLEEYLGDAGHEARMAHDGPQALSVAREFIPELVLLDIGLPVMDGYEVAKHIRENPRTAQTRLVAARAMVRRATVTVGRPASTSTW